MLGLQILLRFATFLMQIRPPVFTKEMTMGASVTACHWWRCLTRFLAVTRCQSWMRFLKKGIKM